jgi:hypothetical protein
MVVDIVEPVCCDDGLRYSEARGPGWEGPERVGVKLSNMAPEIQVGPYNRTVLC